jgi:hypothetical protein
MTSSNDNVTELEEERRKRDAARILREEGDSKKLRFLGLEEFVQRPAISSHVAGIIPVNSIVVVFGPPKGGKTFSVCDLTMHAAHGMDWHGLKVKRPVRVAYLLGEGINGCRVRLRAWLQRHDAGHQAGEFRILPQALSLPDHVHDIVEALGEFRPDIIVADTLNAFFGSGNENATQDMTRFCDAVRFLRDTLEASVIVIHHTGIADQTRERGSFVLRGTADVIIQVARAESGSGAIGFQVIEARDLESWKEPIALKLRQVEIDWTDDDGMPLRTCIVEAASEAVNLSGRGGRPLGGTQATVLSIVQELAKTAIPDAHGDVVIERCDVSKIAKDRHNISKSSVSSCWRPLERRKYFTLLESSSIVVKAKR